MRAIPDFTSNTLALALQLRKITENLSQGNRMALGCSTQNAIRFVELDHRGGWPRLACCPCDSWLSRQATGSTLGQYKYLPSCRTGGFLTSANFESKLSVRTQIWSANRNAQILVYLPITYVPRGTSSEAKTLGL